MTNNHSAGIYCVDVIRAVMNGTPVPPVPEGIDLQTLFAFSKLHSVECLVYHGLEQLEPEPSDPVWSGWRSRADLLLTQSIVQLSEKEQLLQLLPGAGIRLLPVKGCWLKELYPEIDYRQMSDLDILVPEEQAQAVRRAMEKLGYTFQPFAATNENGFSKPPYMEVEIHTALLPADSPHFDYYADIWNRAEEADGYPGVLRLRPEDEYIYYLLHLYKHVRFAGSGIRSFLDSVVYRRAFPDMDAAYLENEYRKLGISDFARQVETLSDCWFADGGPVPEGLSGLAASVLAAGTYGTEEALFQSRLEDLRKKYRNPLAVNVLYWLSRVFLPMKEMRLLYPVLNKVPLLLPLCWVWRLVSVWIRDPGALLHQIKLVRRESAKKESDQ